MPDPSESDAPGLSRKPGRQYNLALAPEIIYSGSAFRRHLVASQVHRQVGFLPVGSWWVYTPHNASGSASGSFEKVPNTREDLFDNNTLDFPAKRKLVKILRFILDYEHEDEKAKWQQHRALPFSDFLSTVFKAPNILSAPLLALTMSTQDPDHVTTDHALPKIARHLRSVGTLGKFSALVPKYGGLDEFCQVACRACAVGGGVYVLGKGLSTSPGSVSIAQIPVESLSAPVADATNNATFTMDDSAPVAEGVPGVKLRLEDGEAVTTRWVVSETEPTNHANMLCKSVTIVSSSLSTLFQPVMVEDKPFQPGSAVLVFPSGSLSLSAKPDDFETLPPVHIQAHSSDSGECPAGQSELSPVHPFLFMPL